MNSTHRWICGCCGKEHEGIPDSYGYDSPWYWDPAKNSDRGRFLDQDYCVIDDDFFVRGCIEIPILGSENPFLWGVWSSLSKQNFEHEMELAANPERTNEPAYFGWLSTRLEIYPDTLSLKCNVHSRPPGQRPYIELQPCDHPLVVEQHRGITLDRVIEIAEQMEHGWRHPEWDSKLE